MGTKYILLFKTIYIFLKYFFKVKKNLFKPFVNRKSNIIDVTIRKLESD